MSDLLGLAERRSHSFTERSISCSVALLFNKVFILFPDPWPKKRHYKKRLIQAAFLSCIARKMDKHGRLFFRTDHEEYFGWAKEIFMQHPDWRINESQDWPFEASSYFQELMDSWQSLIAVKV